MPLKRNIECIIFSVNFCTCEWIVQFDLEHMMTSLIGPEFLWCFLTVCASFCRKKVAKTRRKQVEFLFAGKNGINRFLPAKTHPWYALSPDFKENLPTHKLSPERDFSYFDSLSRVLESYNIKFSASNLRSDLNLVSLDQPHRVKTICNEVGQWTKSQIMFIMEQKQQLQITHYEKYH